MLIRVKAVGVNFADLMQRMGIYPGVPKPPFVPGFEVAGVVEKVGDGGRDLVIAMTFRPGDAVCAITQYQRLLAMGGGAGAASLPIARRNAVRRRRGAARQLYDGLSRDVRHGQFAIGRPHLDSRGGGRGGNRCGAIGAGQGAWKFSGRRGRAKQEYLRKIGVDHAIDYEKSDFVEVVRKFSPDGIEMVMDAIGGKSFANSYKCLGPTGRLVVYGLSAAAGPDGKKSAPRGLSAILQTPRFNPLRLMADNITVIGISLGKMPSRSGA